MYYTHTRAYIYIYTYTCYTIEMIHIATETDEQARRIPPMAQLFCSTKRPDKNRGADDFISSIEVLVEKENNEGPL